MNTSQKHLKDGDDLAIVVDRSCIDCRASSWNLKAVMYNSPNGCQLILSIYNQFASFLEDLDEEVERGISSYIANR